MNVMEMLWRVEDVLQSRRVGVEVRFPGYIEIKDHDHIYSPGGGWWLLAPSTRQSEKLDAIGRARGCRDVEQVVNSIIAHLSATKKSA